MKPDILQTMKGAIFDLDGVLVDTARFHFQAWRRLARELGFEFTETHNERLKGVSRMRSLEILLQVGGLTLSEDRKAALADQKNAWYLDLVARMGPGDLLPGAREYVAHVRARGVRTALASASRNAPLILDRVGIRDLFDVLVDGNRATRAKPDPEAFLVAAAEIGVPPAACVVFEDAAAGVEAARRAGMGVVGVGEKGVLGTADLVVGDLAALL